ncbi:hypothetical protein EDC55_1412 [Allofrancisella inopinata]|nr:hypothetical protein EDC55_1412 [Allofrancisella inopinata]
MNLGKNLLLIVLKSSQNAHLLHVNCAFSLRLESVIYQKVFHLIKIRVYKKFSLTCTIIAFKKTFYIKE